MVLSLDFVTFLFIITFCLKTVWSSAYYNNEFFARISKSDVANYWNGNIDMSSYARNSFSCETIIK